ncbi:MAG TPA: TlpA disulfide reductase family protein [Propionibacteriaceae bacterium]|nr:TlpA disulfide reductase family protein [Propionibacteriaceae bacterium]
MRRRLAAIAMAGLLVLAGCGQDRPLSVQAGGGPASASVGPSLLAQRKAAGIPACPATNVSATQVAGGLPATVLDCVGGDSRVNLAGLPTGTPIVLNFWAQWCGPCRLEGPVLGTVYAKAKAKGTVRMLGVMEVEPAPDAAIALARQDGMLYPMMVDPTGKARTALKVTALPQTLFIDAQGRVVKRVIAPFDSAQQLESTIRQVFGVSLG